MLLWCGGCFGTSRAPAESSYSFDGRIDRQPLTHLSKHPQIGLLTSEASSIHSYLLQLHYVIMRVSNPLTYIIQFFLKPRGCSTFLDGLSAAATQLPGCFVLFCSGR